MKVILKEEVLLRDSRDALLSMSKRVNLWTMSYISLTKTNKQTYKQTKKSKGKKAISKRCVISCAGIDDRFTFRPYNGLSESERQHSERSLKNALIFSSCVGPDLQEEWVLSEKS